MPHYLYTYIHLFGYIGAGTPEDPGTDFGMSVWIDAPDEDAARCWGKVVLDDYVHARFQHSEDAGIDAAWGEGWIEKDDQTLKRAEGFDYPLCQVGQIPAWAEPWKRHNCRQRSIE